MIEDKIPTEAEVQEARKRCFAARVRACGRLSPFVTKDGALSPIEAAALPAALAPYAWPGGYLIVYWTDDGDALCAECATNKLSDPDVWEGELPAFGDVYFEGETQECVECGCELESAYGDPNKEEADP